MKIKSIASTILLAGSLAFPLSVLGDSPSTAEVEISPSELHQYLGEQKATALARQRLLQSIASAEAAQSQTDYDVLWYDISIRVNDTTEMIYGTVTLRARAVLDGLTEVEVDYDETMTLSSVTGSTGALLFSRSGDVVTVNLGQSYDQGQVFEFSMDYSGSPPGGGLKGFAFDTYGGELVISTLSEPYSARTWWPCKDRMDDKADSIGIHIEVDTSLYCASNGTLDSIVTVPGSNSRTFHYTCHYPIATYLFSLAIAPYVVWEQEYVYDGGQGTMPVIHHVYPDWDSHSRSTWGETPQMLGAFSQVYGEYPFLTEKYGHANFIWNGAMEHQTVSSMAPSSFGFSAMVIAHELSHQWWGDLVTCESWQDIWLNEGWASYSEAVYQLHTSGWSAYRSYMNLMAYKGGGTVWCNDTTDVWRIFSGNLSYDKGAWVVHMLRGFLGETLFAQGIEAYRAAFAYSSATTAEFQAVWESATGVDLDAFIQQWIYGQYYPKYTYYYMDEPSDSGGYDIYLIVEQTQTTNPRVFQMPVDFFFDYTAITDDTLVLNVDERRETFRFNETSPVSSIALDPAGWILKDAFPEPWELFIISLPEDISVGVVDEWYEDTVEIRGAVPADDVLIVGGQLPPGLTIDDNGIIAGVPTEAGQYIFDVGVVNYTEEWADQVEFGLEVSPASCCVGQVGDANNSGGDTPTIGDITAMIDMLFISFVDVECLLEADINQSGGTDPVRSDITIGDITKLIDHLFISHPPLPECL